jgi:hypothetical protein
MLQGSAGFASDMSHPPLHTLRGALGLTSGPRLHSRGCQDTTAKHHERRWTLKIVFRVGNSNVPMPNHGIYSYGFDIGFKRLRGSLFHLVQRGSLSPHEWVSVLLTRVHTCLMDTL